eukprot:m.5534 g.5534  ORF g.5534 m.5534 type:complete len:60 (+) comp2422_c0_seq1:318-497(+)
MAHHHQHGSKHLLVVAILAFFLGTVFGYKMKQSMTSFNQWRYKKLKSMTDKAKYKLEEG